MRECGLCVCKDVCDWMAVWVCVCGKGGGQRVWVCRETDLELGGVELLGQVIEGKWVVFEVANLKHSLRCGEVVLL